METDGRVVQGDVGHFALAAHQVGALAVQVERRQRLVAFEDVEAPATLGDACLGRFAVFDYHTVEHVLLFRPFARKTCNERRTRSREIRECNEIKIRQ